MATDRINNFDRGLNASPIDRLETQLHLIQTTRTKETRVTDRQIRNLIRVVSFLAAIIVVENAFILAFALWGNR